MPKAPSTVGAYPRFGFFVLLPIVTIPALYQIKLTITIIVSLPVVDVGHIAVVGSGHCSLRNRYAVDRKRDKNMSLISLL